LQSDTPLQAESPQSNTRQGVNLEMVYRSLLNIVARLEENQYTEGMLRQIDEGQLDDLANPAGAGHTSQG
jgi:hypothetical protein